MRAVRTRPVAVAVAIGGAIAAWHAYAPQFVPALPVPVRLAFAWACTYLASQWFHSHDASKG